MSFLYRVPCFLNTVSCQSLFNPFLILHGLFHSSHYSVLSSFPSALMRHLKGCLLVFYNLLLDHILIQYLIEELERLLLNELIVKSYTIGWLNDVRLVESGILHTK